MRLGEVGLESIWRDVRHAFRIICNHAAFAATAVLTLAIGIGGATAMFTVIVEFAKATRC